MSRSFPGGICDDEGKAAYLLPATGELHAVDLSDGKVRWSRRGAGRPIAASASHLLTVRDEGVAAKFALLDTDTGRQVAEIDPASVPDFGRVSPGDAIEAEIVETGEGSRISWSSESRYGGGAAPPRSLAPGRPAGGTFLVDSKTAEVRPLRPEPGSSPSHARSARAAGNDREESKDSGSRLALKAESGALIFEARRGDGGLLWRTRLGDAPESKPRALRP